MLILHSCALGEPNSHVKALYVAVGCFFFSSRRRHTRCGRDWSSDVCSSDLVLHLVKEGVLVQRHGSGTFVAPLTQRVEQSLSQLTSFTEDMARRGMAVHAEWLDRGLYAPSPEETVILGLSTDDLVARIARLRLTGDTPLAIERASLSARTLPDPEAIGDSLYTHLDKTGNRPTRAIQRIRAANLAEEDALLLEVPVGSAGLNIERTSYLASGRVIEFTRS